MTETLKQRRLFSKRQFELTNQELSVKSHSLKEKKEFTIKLDTLGQEIYYQSDPPVIKNIIAAICGLVPVAITIAYFFAKEPPDSATTVVNIVIWTPMAKPIKDLFESLDKDYLASRKDNFISSLSSGKYMLMNGGLILEKK